MKTMHRIISLSLTKSLWLFILLACQSQEKNSSDNLSIATQDYAVLAEKTISYQADFDMDSWSKMLADDVEFGLPSDSSNANFKGKQAAVEAWKNWKNKNKVSKMKFENFTQIPVNSKKTVKFSAMPGVYVFSLFDGKIFFTNGSTSTLRMNYCFHFNNEKMIDRYYTFHDKLTLTQN